MIKRDTATDRLGKVIQVIQLGKKTGILTVERGEGTMFEEGFLVFLHGQVTEAKVGLHRGLAAFNSLSAWGPCRFAFVPQQVEDLTSHSHEAEAAENALRPPLPTITGSHPVPRVPMEDITPRHTVIPSRICSVAEAMVRIGSLGLSRTHKHLFLLIDGHRNIVELTRLTGRRPNELMQLLADLKRIGVIQL